MKLGKTILKDINKFWKLCIYANFACAYQGYPSANPAYGRYKNATNIAKG